MGSLPRAILLDLDDTILDDSGGVIACWRDACLAHRSSMNGLDADTVFEAIDRTREWYWSDPERHRVGRLELAWARGEVVRLALAELGVDDEGLARQIGDTYHALRDDAIKPFDDAVPTVQWLRAQGCRLALLTNGGSKGQRLKIDRFDLAPLFDAILIANAWRSPIGFALRRNVSTSTGPASSARGNIVPMSAVTTTKPSSEPSSSATRTVATPRSIARA